MLSCKYPVFEVDTIYFQSAVHELLSSILMRAIRAWYREFWDKVHVYSGMAKGEFIPLGEEIGDVPITISSEEINPKWKNHRNANRYGPVGNRENRIDLGEKFGETSYTIETEKGIYHFHFNYQVPHTVENYRLDAFGFPEAIDSAAKALKNEIEMAMLETRLSRLLSESIHVTYKETR